jgi:FixJ family two-component response regulator
MKRSATRRTAAATRSGPSHANSDFSATSSGVVLAGDDLAKNAWFADVAHSAGLAVIREPDLVRLPSWYGAEHGPIVLSGDGEDDASHRAALPPEIRAHVVAVTWRQNWPSLHAWMHRGAADFIRMPASEQEVLLRLQSVRLRLETTTRAQPAKDPKEDAFLALLSKREEQLYRVFKAHANQVLSRSQLRELAWSEAETRPVASNVVDVYVCYLRGKLARAKLPATIETVRGEGYVFRYRS